jgi:uroporphyrinogen III methyltransferase/synthase
VSTGRVHLVGAGPGDPGLLTARALELIARADVILYDRLIPPGALDGARSDAELIYVGKEGGGPSMGQEEIERLLAEHAGAGAEVVRLKGGDPFIFGRGGEEALTLRAAGIAFEVVPGVTSGVAAPAYAGIPVTQRGAASAVALVTGHEDPDKPESAIDWPALAAFPGTLVFYMGVRQLPRIVQQLRAAGRPAAEPVAIVQSGTLPGQRAVLGTLETIVEKADAAQIRPPSITVVGPVAALRDELAWFEARPLAGVTVAVTRARAQASSLAAKLRELGATALEAPAIRVEALAGPTPDVASYDLVCLTSPNGVRFLFDRLGAAGLDARALHGATVAAIGPGTARALGEHGVKADVVPERFVAESLVEALSEQPVRRALVARAEDARDVLPDALRARGAEVDVLALYRTTAEKPEPAVLEQVRAADYVTFTSASTVRFLLAAAGSVGGSSRLVSIGPVTSEALREQGLEPHVEAAEHDIDGLIAALVADARAAHP